MASYKIWLTLAIAAGVVVLPLLLVVSVFSREIAAVIFWISFLATSKGLAVAKNKKQTYYVRIGSASSETNVLSSEDRAYVENIIDAVNTAIKDRG